MIQQVLTLHNEGISQRKISQHTGLSQSTIRRYILFPKLAKQLYKRPERAKKMDAFHTLLIDEIIEAVKHFRQLIKAKKSEELSNWVTQVKTVNFYGVVRFFNGLSRDIDAVKNAIIYDYNNGLAEGWIYTNKVNSFFNGILFISRH